uniref:Uncharacterized protein n=1 Tax=Timema bartmani TaxID=61472 RepID=A0A7R9I2P1_9NEOP|nr:unnamed protein product [Timema bartmani]
MRGGQTGASERLKYKIEHIGCNERRPDWSERLKYKIEHIGCNERRPDWSERATERARLKDRTGSIFQARALKPFTQPRFGASSSTTNESYLLILHSLASLATQSLACSLAHTLVSLAEPLTADKRGIQFQRYSESNSNSFKVKGSQ